MTDRPRMQACPKCRNPLKDSTYERTLDVAGRTFVGCVPSEKCDECPEEYLWGPGLVAFDLSVAIQLIRKRVRNGTVHRFCRKAIALSDEEVAALNRVAVDELLQMEASSVSLPQKYWDVLVPLVELEFSEYHTRVLVKMKCE